jgi:hypothetical protein
MALLYILAFLLLLTTPYIQAQPTEAPTEEPTEAPTEEPTEAPTEEEPTEAPTEEEPTEAPTEEEPTEAPTEEEPTEAPTEEEPTEAPTEEEPTEAPTEEEPTEAPTEEQPTEAPTEEEPTQAPTEEEPTEAPTEATAPTEAPSEAPTSAPTSAPTDAPTGSPTASPNAPTTAAQVESRALYYSGRSTANAYCVGITASARTTINVPGVIDVSACNCTSVSVSYTNQTSFKSVKFSVRWRCSAGLTITDQIKSGCNAAAAAGIASVANTQIVGTFYRAQDFTLSGWTTASYQGFGLASSSSSLFGGLFFSFVALLLAFL